MIELKQMKLFPDKALTPGCVDFPGSVPLHLTSKQMQVLDRGFKRRSAEGGHSELLLLTTHRRELFLPLCMLHLLHSTVLWPAGYSAFISNSTPLRNPRSSSWAGPWQAVRGPSASRMPLPGTVPVMLPPTAFCSAYTGSGHLPAPAALP